LKYKVDVFKALIDSLSSVESIDIRTSFLIKILGISDNIPDYRYRAELLSKVFNALSLFPSQITFKIMEEYHESHGDIREVVLSYTESIRDIKWSLPEYNKLLSYYIRSFLWAPHGEYAVNSANSFVGHMIQTGKLEEALEASRALEILIK